MIPRQSIFKKANIKKTFSSSRKNKNHTRWLSGLLAVFILLGVLAACKPANSETSAFVVTPTEIIPTATYVPPQPDTALKNALEKFDSYQSFTFNRSIVYDSGTFGNTTTTIDVSYIDQVDAISLLDSESTSLIDSKYQRLCLQENCYKTDATGLLKPAIGKFSPNKPSLGYLDMDVAEILNSTNTYLGEEMVGELRTYKYEMADTEELMSDSDLKLVEPKPEVYFYVDAESGNLVKLSYAYQRPYGGAVDNYEITVEYSDWNTTTFTVPEYVDAQNTEWQPYTGAYASAVSFEFPKVYFLTEYFEYPSLKTPSGSQMDFTIYETIALLSDDQYSDLCSNVFNEFVLAFDSMSPTLERAEWIQTENYNFCKGVINTSDGQRVEYLFNEPMEVAGAAGRLLPETFRIIIYLAEGDADTIFWDVIQTIRIGASE